MACSRTSMREIGDLNPCRPPLPPGCEFKLTARPLPPIKKGFKLEKVRDEGLYLLVPFDVINYQVDKDRMVVGGGIAEQSLHKGNESRHIDRGC